MKTYSLKNLANRKFCEIEVKYSSTIPKDERTTIINANDTELVCRAIYDFNNDYDYKEKCYVICLNYSNDIIGVNCISEGGVSATVVDIKHVFQTALLCNASSIIICHNHCSGNVKPSPADHKICDAIKKSGEILGIELIDNVIITRENFYSFMQNNVL